MRIMIDGDGSPVKEDVIEIAGLYQVEVMIVTSVAHYTHKDIQRMFILCTLTKAQIAQITALWA